MKFSHFARTHIDEMIVLGRSQRLLELRDILSELMLYNQFAVQQDLNGVVQSSPADTLVFIFHRDVKRLDVKMTVAGVDLIQNGISFRRLTVTVSFKVFRKNIFDCLFIFLHAIHT